MLAVDDPINCVNVVLPRPVPTITLRKEGYNTLLGKTTGNIKRLVIDSFKEYNAGKYGCTASGPSGQTKTKSTVITMESKEFNIICFKAQEPYCMNRGLTPKGHRMSES